MEMRTFLLLIFVFASTFAVASDLENYNLSGLVKFMKEVFSGAIEKDGKIVKGSESAGKNTHVKFDEDGNLLEETKYYSSTGAMASVRVIEYDDEGNKISDAILDKDGNETNKWVYKYDSDILVSKQMFLKEKLYIDTKIEYDKNWNKIAEINLDPEGEEIDRTTYTYNDSGELIEEFRRGTDKFIYGKNGLASSLERYASKDKLQFRYNFEYDEADNLISKKRTQAIGNVDLIETMKYDENGLLLVENGVFNGEPFYTYSYSYDEYGNVISKLMEESGEEEANHEFRYQYDENGNWTENIHLLNGKPLYIYERSIEYWE